MTTLDYLMQTISRLKAKTDSIAVYRWATVTALGPLRITLDGEADPLIASPTAFVRDLFVGDRVQVRLVDRRAYVVGKPRPVPEYQSAGITFVDSESEAAALPEGTVYAIVPMGAPVTGDVELVAQDGAQLTGTAFSPTLNGAVANDRIIVAINTRGIPNMTITPPDGFTPAVGGYWAGTEKFYVYFGMYRDSMSFQFSETTEVAYAAFAVRGAVGLSVGPVKNRGEGTPETTTITAPAASAGDGDLVLGFGFERTGATETSDQVTVSEGWEKILFVEQNAHYQTICVARRTLTVGNLTITYPNPQAYNGGGVQVVAHDA